MKKFLKYWLPVIVWAGIIFTLSSIPNLKSGLDQDFTLRKIAHILEYAILTYLLIRAFHSLNFQFGKILIPAIIGFVYALSDEFHQTFIFGRKGRFEDVVIDSIGILLAGLLWYYITRKYED
ncbi:MAG: VanZ family protein [Atribacterota bacterium]